MRYILDADDDEIIVKLPELPARVYAATYVYKSHTAVHRTLLSSAIGVSFICYTIGLCKEKNLRLICPGCPQFQKEDLHKGVNLLHNRDLQSIPAYLVVCAGLLSFDRCA